MKVVIKKWGNSFGIRLPKHILSTLEIRENSPLTIEIKNNTILLKKEETLDDMLARITNDNIHPETDTGAVTGKEIW